MHHARLRTALQKLLLFCWLPAFGAAPEFTPMESCCARHGAIVRIIRSRIQLLPFITEYFKVNISSSKSDACLTANLKQIILRGNT